MHIPCESAAYAVQIPRPVILRSAATKDLSLLACSKPPLPSAAKVGALLAAPELAQA